MYALRDVTATVDSIPLIAASIMAKKLAEGIDGLVLDVKTGNGAFMSRRADARRLAATMIAIGKGMGKEVVALLTNMDQPLGRAVGNAVEVIEVIEALKGRWEPDLKQVTLELGARMLVMAGKTTRASHALMRRALCSGDALARFREMVKAQGGDVRVIDDYARLPQARLNLKAVAPHSGFVQAMDTQRIGMLSVRLGAGRAKKEDAIDPAVGFWFRRRLGEPVKRGEVLAEVLANDRRLGQEIARELVTCFKIGAKRIVPPRLIEGLCPGHAQGSDSSVLSDWSDSRSGSCPQTGRRGGKRCLA